MKIFLLLIFSALLVGCHGESEYEEDEVLARVFDDEIFYEDTKMVFPTNDDVNLRDRVQQLIQVRLMEHENELAGLDLEDEIDEQQYGMFGMGSDVELSDLPDETYDKLAEQAEAVEMEVDDYFHKWTRMGARSSVHTNHYLEREFNDLEAVFQEDHEEASRIILERLQELMESYEDDIEIYL
ncbi:hypothetical protein [Halalkalibacillus halophilus]|uniref:hypothetical protein n=1 Tax=Halalkalibacillus halophilus TaxID=392827 RepID=UPI0003FCA3C5|nr:hypothetical protein [Halalkalibacillus halophilus]